MDVGILLEILFSFIECRERFHREWRRRKLEVPYWLIDGFSVRSPTILSAALVLLERRLNSASAQDEREVNEKLQSYRVTYTQSAQTGTDSYISIMIMGAVCLLQWASLQLESAENLEQWFQQNQWRHCTRNLTADWVNSARDYSTEVLETTCPSRFLLLTVFCDSVWRRTK
jgi:hypothetical protein